MIQVFISRNLFSNFSCYFFIFFFHLKSLYYFKYIFGQFQIVLVFPILRVLTLMYTALTLFLPWFTGFHSSLSSAVIDYFMRVSYTLSYKKSFMFTSERESDFSWLTFPPSQTLEKQPLPSSTQEQCVECFHSLRAAGGYCSKIHAGHSVLNRSLHVHLCHYLTIRNAVPN